MSGRHSAGATDAIAASVLIARYATAVAERRSTTIDVDHAGELGSTFPVPAQAVGDTERMRHN